MAEGGAANLGTLEAHIGLNTRRLSRDSMRAQGIFRRLGRNVSVAAGGITRAMGGATAAVAGLGVAAVGVYALVRAFKAANDAGIQFEQTMAVVGGVMRATANEQKKLSAIAREMGETTEFTATQAADALQFLGMAGFQAAEGIEALPGVLDLATAGQIDLGEAADIATNALTAMGLPVSELTRVNDVFVGTITRSNTNMRMLAESFRYAAPVARAYGYSIEELSGLIGMLGNAGIQASMAGTSLSRAIIKSAEIARKMKMESSDLVDVIGELRDRGYSAIDMMQLFDIRSGKVAAVLFNVTEKTRDFQNTLTGVGGEAKTLADIMRSTLGGSMKELKSVIESVLIDAFQRYRDKLQSTIKSITRWIRANKEQLLSFVDAIIKAVSKISKAVSMAWDVVSSFFDGVSAFFAEVKKETAGATDQIVRDAARLRVALRGLAPDLTPYQQFKLKFEAVFNAMGRDMFALGKLLARNLATVMTTLLVLIVDTLKAAVELTWLGSKAIAAAMLAMFTGESFASALGGPLNDLSDLFSRTVDKMDATGKAFISGFGDAFAIALDEVGIKMLQATKDRNELMEAGFVRGGLRSPFPTPFFSPLMPEGVPDPIDHAKDVSEGMPDLADQLAKERRMLNLQLGAYETLLDGVTLTAREMADVWDKYVVLRVQQIKNEVTALTEAGMKGVDIKNFVAEREAQIEADRKMFFRETLDDLRKLNSAHLDAFESIMDGAKMSSTAALHWWGKYHVERMTMIRLEERAMVQQGVSAQLVAATVVRMTQELARERQAFLDKHMVDMGKFAGALRQWARQLSDDLTYTFERQFFDILKNNFKGVLDFLSAITDVFLRDLSRKMAEAASQWLKLSPGGIPLPGGGSGGGSDLLPTPDSFGLNPVSASVPTGTHRLNDPVFLKSMRDQGGAGDTHVTVNVQAVDVRSFMATRQQIATELAVATTQARRNL